MKYFHLPITRLLADNKRDLPVPNFVPGSVTYAVTVSHCSVTYVPTTNVPGTETVIAQSLTSVKTMTNAVTGTFHQTALITENRLGLITGHIGYLPLHFA